VAGFDPKKTAADRDLFVGADGSMVGVEEDWKIETQVIPFGVGKEMSTKSGRFKGYVDKRAHKLYVDAGYTKLYRVSLSNKCLTAAMGGGSISCWPEPQDKLITKVLDKYHPTLKQGNHYYCLGETGGDVDFLKPDKENPIQSWHPVYRYGGDLEYANFAHIADIHIAARQQVLAKTTARVIDYVDAGAEAALARRA
ncbi:MAG: hypothetical protein NTX04_03785, partial [Verrucomicrobia bacterium]|nr:hypothetical protein [Verrucomicrobiota bacterium]